MKGVEIRKMGSADIGAVHRAFEHWNKKLEQYQTYYQENLDGWRHTLVAFSGSEVVGYGNLLEKSYYPPFRQDGVPEINDLNVIEERQGQGLGTRLIGELEKLAKELGYKRVGIGVVLAPDYARAQRLYPYLGYELDGRGVSFSPEGEELHYTKAV